MPYLILVILNLVQLIHDYIQLLKRYVEYQTHLSAIRIQVSLTTIKYITQSAEQMVSKTKVIRPSSDPVAPVTDVGGLFNREERKYLMGALRTPSSQLCQLFFLINRRNKEIHSHETSPNVTCFCTSITISIWGEGDLFIYLLTINIQFYQHNP